MPDYIPRNDADFDAWFAIFKAYATANAVALGLTPAQVADLAAASGTWIAAYAAVEPAKNAAKLAVSTKEVARDAAEDLVRALTAIVQANPAVTDIDRTGLGITIAKTPGVIPVPTAVPDIFVDFSRRAAHIIHWGTNPMEERYNGKPEGVLSCEIRRHVGDLPPGMPQDDFEFVAIDTQSPYTANMSAFGNAMVHWTARYLNAKGQPGLWCEVSSALVTL